MAGAVKINIDGSDSENDEGEDEDEDEYDDEEDAENLDDPDAEYERNDEHADGEDQDLNTDYIDGGSTLYENYLADDDDDEDDDGEQEGNSAGRIQALADERYDPALQDV